MTKQPGSIFSVDVTGLETAIGEPAYARICDRIRSAITSGALAPNARLPSSRMLARDFRVARNTVDSALGQLVADGYIVRRRGAGSFVAGHLPERDLYPRSRKRAAMPKSKADNAERRLSQRAQALRINCGVHPSFGQVQFQRNAGRMN